MPADLFREVDRALFAAALVERLRSAGLRPPLASTERFAEALEVARPRSRSQLYWTARTCLVDDVSQHERFDRVFAAVFDRDGLHLRRPTAAQPASPATPAADRDVHVPLRDREARLAGGGGVPWVTLPSVGESDDGPDTGLRLAERLPSELAAVAEVPFDELDDEQLAAVGALLESTVGAWPRRRVRRRRRTTRRRTVDHRRTLRGATRTGGVPVLLTHTMRSTRPRRLVMLADVSGSMQSYARAYLHVMRALGRRAEAETFAVSTRLTRLTPSLRHDDPRVAIDRATRDVDDRFSGTRLASSLRELLASPTWSTSVRGAVVVIASDGWDTDPPAELARRMARLRRLAHRVVWVDPRAAAPGFVPAVAGLVAALPHCDALVSGHSLAAMDELFRELAADG